MNISSDQPCVSICCEHGDTIYHPGAKCYWNVSFATEESFFPKEFDLKWGSKIKPNDLLPRNMTSCLNDTVCYSDCMPGNNISTYLFGNGMIAMNASIDVGLSCRLDVKDYCFNSYTTDGTQNIMFVCKTFFDLITNMKLHNNYVKRIQLLYLSSMTISLPFFLATLLIYTIVPELKNLHGLLLRSYISCCFLYFVTMVTFASDPILSCNIFMLTLFHFGFLDTYFWLNIMCFDIWWTFRSLNESSNQSFRMKYIFYSIYSWGIPFLLVSVNLILNFDTKYLEKVTEAPRRCWLQDKQMRLVYFNLPATVVVASNICFFILTIINIIRQKKAAAQCLNGNESRRYNEEKNRFYVYLKLFIIMGMPIIAEILPFVVQVDIPDYISFVLVLPNFIQGPIIFILFVWNVRIKRLLAKHLGLKDWLAIQWMERSIVRIRTLLRGSEPS